MDDADAVGGAAVIAILLAGFALQYVVFSAVTQLLVARCVLRGRAQPEWDAWLGVLRAGAAGPVQALVVRTTLPICLRLWPPAGASGVGTGESGPPPPRS